MDSLWSHYKAFIHSFIHSFIRSFIHSFVRSFVHSFILSFLPSFFIRWFGRSFDRSFIQLLKHSVSLAILSIRSAVRLVVRLYDQSLASLLDQQDTQREHLYRIKMSRGSIIQATTYIRCELNHLFKCGLNKTRSARINGSRVIRD